MAKLASKKMTPEKKEFLTALTKGFIGMVPVIGPIIAEIVGVLIPNQRIQRIESLITKLESKLKHLAPETIKGLMNNPEAIDLMEDGFLQASKAISEDRKEHIASLLKNSLTDSQLKYIQYKRLLSILGELNDLEVLILKSLTFLHGEEGSNEFWEKHEKALDEPIAYLGSPKEEWDKVEIYKTHKEHLVRLGLLTIRFNKPKKGEIPEFDEHTGMIKAQGHDITYLGELLLRSIE